MMKDVQGVWELPVAILLPPFYALIVPIARVALSQWRVRRAPCTGGCLPARRSACRTVRRR